MSDAVITRAKQIDPWAWTSYAFGTSDRELYLTLKARREASVRSAQIESSVAKDESNDC